MIVSSNRRFASSGLRTLPCLCLFVAASIAVLAAIGRGGSASPRADGRRIVEGANTKIAPWVIEHTATGQQAEFFVVLREQADLSGAAALATKGERAATCTMY
jgi:hypothetical protein